MRKLVLGLIGASALAISSAASAVVIITPATPLAPGDNGGTAVFVTSPSPVLPTYTGSITATIGHTGIGAGTFTDIFQFTIGTAGLGVIGLGSGSIITSVNLANFLGTTDLDITSVSFNGMMANLQLLDANGNPCDTRDTVPGAGTCGANETWSLNDVPITAGALDQIIVSGLSRGNGSYGGNLTFTPNAVPEPATWAMMLFGFAGIGWQLRRKRTGAALAQFA
jgi:hypothetical protein